MRERGQLRPHFGQSSRLQLCDESASILGGRVTRCHGRDIVISRGGRFDRLVRFVVCRGLALPRPLPRQRSCQVDTGDVLARDEDLAEGLSRLLLVGKRGVELVRGQAPLVDEHLAHVGPAVGLCPHRHGRPPGEDAQRPRGGSFE